MLEYAWQNDFQQMIRFYTKKGIIC